MRLSQKQDEKRRWRVFRCLTDSILLMFRNLKNGGKYEMFKKTALLITMVSFMMLLVCWSRPMPADDMQKQLDDIKGALPKICHTDAVKSVTGSRTCISRRGGQLGIGLLHVENIWMALWILAIDQACWVMLRGRIFCRWHFCSCKQGYLHRISSFLRKCTWP